MTSKFSLYQSGSWNNRVGSMFGREDIHGNKMFHITKNGMYNPIRYVEYQNIVYFSVNDVLLSFVDHSNLSFQSIWDNLPNECQTELERHMYRHTFVNDDEKESRTLRYNDILKLIMLIPVTFDFTYKNVDLFIQYHQTHFGYLYNIKKAPMVYKIDCCLNYLLIMAMLVGFVCAFLLFWLLHMFKFQE